MNKILLINKINNQKVLEYESNVIPIIGDSIVFEDKSLFTVWSRVLSSVNTNIVLIGDMIWNNKDGDII